MYDRTNFETVYRILCYVKIYAFHCGFVQDFPILVQGFVRCHLPITLGSVVLWCSKQFQKGSMQDK